MTQAESVRGGSHASAGMREEDVLKLATIALEFSGPNRWAGLLPVEVRF